MIVEEACCLEMGQRIEFCVLEDMLLFMFSRHQQAAKNTDGIGHSCSDL